MRRFGMFVLSLLATSLVPLVVLAQPKPGPKTAITDPALADADFAIQGEYAGWMYMPGSGNQYTGLQIVALGGGKFDAMQYRGGLPGNGWDRATRTKLSGEMDGDYAVLAGEDVTYFVGGMAAVARDTAGRPLGRLVKVERTSRMMGLQPPPNAIVLFDGGPTDEMVNPKITPDGLLMSGVMTKMPVDAFRMHLEFRTPYMPYARGQGRANSGVYIQTRYEVQILDSFGLEGVENECGGLYRQTRPDLNMCLPPLAWQTYDIWFTPPRFAEDGKTKTANARLTVLHNGVPIHWHREVIAKTGGGKAEAPQPLPINLQDHGNPVAFRNIWLIPRYGDEAYGWQPARQYQQAGATQALCCCGQKRGLFRRCR